jgi:hypothetical protein
LDSVMSPRNSDPSHTTEDGWQKRSPQAPPFFFLREGRDDAIIQV